MTRLGLARQRIRERALGSSRSGPTIHSVAEAVQLAKKRLPKSLFESIGSGAGQELTLRWNLEAFSEVRFRPQAAVQCPNYSLTTTVLGHEISTPVMIAPTGSIRMFHSEGEPGVAKVAGDVGTIHIVSCFMGYSIEQVVAKSSGPVFFDLYMAGGRANVELMLERAKNAGCKAIVITADMAGTHSIERSLGIGARGFIGMNAATAATYGTQLVTKPAWTLDFIRDGMHLDCPMWVKPTGKPATFGDMYTTILEEYPTWEDLPWIRKHWDGPIIVKGILRPEDALKAIDLGVDGIVVSNHGARNVDGSPATLNVLPEVVDSVDGRIEVYFDGGIRRGTDVLKALALGARAVLIGRAYLYPFAAAGSAGVRQILDLFSTDMLAALRSLGCRSVTELDRSYVSFPERDWKQLAVGASSL